MRKFTFCLCLIFSIAPIFTQNLTPQADSLRRAVERLPDDTSKIRVVFRHALFLDKVNLLDNLIFLKNGQQLAQKLGATAWQPEFEMQIGRNHANSGRPDSALFHFVQARTGFQKSGNQRGEAAVLSRIRWVHNYLGDYEKALQFAIETLSIYEKIGDEAGTASALGNLGDVLYSQEKYQESADYFQKSYDLNKKLSRPAEAAVAAQGLGFAYLQLKMFEKALGFQNEALKIRRERSGPRDVATSLNARGNAFKYLKRYPEALQDYQESLKLARESGFLPLQKVCTSNIGHVYNLLGEFGKALPYLLASQIEIEKDNRLDNMVESQMLIADAYAGLGRFDSAYFFRSRQLVLSDSLLNLENQKTMSELQTRYETNQKEVKIAGQGAEISRQKTVIWFVAGILALVLMGGFFLFRLNQKLNKRNEEKEFLIKEIHHRVKNNLQVLSSLLHLQSRNIHDEAALDAVREGQNRVDAMGLIHQKLYMGENLAAVEMQDYLQNLGDTLLDSFGLDERVKIKYLLYPLHLDVDTAIPLGLIINELLTNSLKYAFPDGRTGEVEIKLWTDENRKLCLQISDDGAGKPAPADAKNSTGFGSKLVQILSQKLKGKPEIFQTENGYSTFIRFENFKMA